MRAVCGFSLSLLAWVQPVLAEDVSLLQERVRGSFWQAVHTPSTPRVEAHLRLARAEIEAARVLFGLARGPARFDGLLARGPAHFDTNQTGPEGAARVRRSMERTLTHLGQVLALAPQHREALYLTGKMLSNWGEPARFTAEAIRHLELLQQLDPLYEAEDVALTLGQLYAREPNLERAQQAYEHALKMHLGRTTRGSLLVKLASVCMARGELPRAIEHYEAALAVSLQEERVEALWGLAVALDRAGENKLALLRGIEALREDPRPMTAAAAQQMRAPVHFALPYERFYFEGFENLARLHEQAGNLKLAAMIARDATRVLARTAHVTPTLVQLHDALLDLAEQGQGPLVKIRLSLLEKLTKKVGPARTPWEFPAKLPQEQSDQQTLQVTTYAARALVAFARYREHGGSEAAWAAHVQEHMNALASVLREAAPAMGSFANTPSPRAPRAGVIAEPRRGVTARAPQ